MSDFDTSGLMPPWIDKVQAPAKAPSDEPAEPGSDLPGAPALPDWLAAVEARRAERETARRAAEADWAQEMVDDVQERLAAIGIVPVHPAHVDTNGKAAPALLVPADPTLQLYGVYAGWDEDDGLCLSVADHNPDGFAGLRPGRRLRAVDDVVEARREGPTSPPKLDLSAPMERDQLRAAAMRGVNTGPGEKTSADADAIVAAFGALTAAVLYTADTITRVNDRP